MEEKPKNIQSKIKVGISQGDINGISYEIIIKSLMDNRIFEQLTPILYGSSKVLTYHRKAINVNNFSMYNIKSPADANLKRANIINCLDDNIRVELGKSTTMAGEASFVSLEKATDDLKNGSIDVLVTAPINKYNIQIEGFNFPGHTEYLMEKFGADDVLMLLVNENLRVGVVTGHVPLKDVSASISKESILSKLRILHKSLIRDFVVTNPRIAVLGLNPHAGDKGLIGKEEQEIIIPAIDAAREEGIMALGPYAADGLFGSDAFSKFDAILAMYHDQGLAPFKALAFSSGVNYTAGLPVVRTSPAHGTAFEIAGKGLANPQSFRQAMFLAVDIFKNRKLYDELSKNPLKTKD